MVMGGVDLGDRKAFSIVGLMSFVTLILVCLEYHVKIAIFFLQEVVGLGDNVANNTRHASVIMRTPVGYFFGGTW